ncbi:hypothetical protein [Ileibacterium valens]|uniref:hypothetical protein n=1 Tax=Ileibacterium valens TaxID=1862668 RepID=UPI00259B9E36|nr:hypothetical protein [Ileibacterium valens]
MRKLKIGLIAVAVLSIIGAASSTMRHFLQVNDPLKIDLMDGVDIEVSGWNGQAKAKVVRGEISYDGNNDAAKKFIDSIQINAEPNTNLSNGDTVTITATYSEDLRALANIDVVSSEKKVIIDDLVGEEIHYEYYDDKTPTVTIDGYEIPASFDTQEAQERYVRYQKQMDSGESVGEEQTVSVWSKGQGEGESERKDTTFQVQDYFSSLDCYKAANDFGQKSSQEYQVEPILEDDKVSGYKVIFRVGTDQ